jgi:sporulation protein YlmC with PRC-barrel domain
VLKITPDLDGNAYTAFASESAAVSAQALVGDAVVNRSGDELGRVAEVMLDLRRGCIESVLVATGGVLGIGCIRIPVLWSRLRCDRRRRCLVSEADTLEP